MTLSPSARKRAASLPMVVVLPVPLTPTMRTTNGAFAVSTVSGCATGASTFSTSPASTARTSSGLMSLSSRSRASASVMRDAVSMPRSAWMSRSSRSSRLSRSSWRLVKTPVMPEVSCCEDRDSPDFSRSHQFLRGCSSSAAGAGVTGGGEMTEFGPKLVEVLGGRRAFGGGAPASKSFGSVCIARDSTAASGASGTALGSEYPLCRTGA